MTDKKLKILIVGVGSIGRRHLSNLIKLGYKNIVVCDPDNDQLNKIAKELKLISHNNLRSAINMEKPAVVFICTPTDRHIAVLKTVIEANADVFMEKPLSTSMAGVNQLIKKVKQKRKIVMVGCNFRFHKGFCELEKCIRSGRYGRPLLIRSVSGYYLPDARPNVDYRNTYAVRKENGGGVILDSGSHVVSYLLSLAGDVSAGVLVKNKINPLGTKVEEAVSVILEHKNSVTSFASFDYFSKKPMHKLEVETDVGLFTLDFRKDNLTFEDEKTSKAIYQGRADTNEMFVDELSHFMACVAQHKKPLQDLAMARRVLQILLSLKSNKPIQKI